MYKGNKMDDMEKTAKKNVLENLRDEAKKMMSSKLGGMKKMDMPKADGAQAVPFSGEETPEEEKKEHKMFEEDELENCSPEELDEKIAMLQALKEKKLSNKAE